MVSKSHLQAINFARLEGEVSPILRGSYDHHGPINHLLNGMILLVVGGENQL